MVNSALILLSVGFVLFQASFIQAQCTNETLLNGTITHSNSVSYNQHYNKCWRILVPSDQYIRLTVNSLSLNSEQCSYVYLRIKVNKTNESYNFCYNDNNRNPVTALSDVEIEFYINPQSGYNGWNSYRTYSFNLDYKIEDIECAKDGSFRCSNFSCIPSSQVCDGVKNCENGSDEVGCETGVVSIPGVKEARLHAIAWMMKKRTPSWGWRENTARGVTSLFLAEDATFNGTNLSEELMAKQAELKTAVALLKRTITNEQLSMFINALLVTCHNPRRFYGQDLVARLKKQVESSGNFTHPLAYLTLCNANESWPLRAAEDLEKVLTSNTEYAFVKDIEAFAVMAISCSRKNANMLNNTKNSTLPQVYKNTTRRFKKHQLSDGSFGNIHTTALVIQALISSGEENSKDWKLNHSIKYLIKELNSSDVDFFAVSLALPILNSKSLADIVHVNCSANPRKHIDEDLVSDINDYTGPKMRVQYSLYVGDNKDVIHTIILRVPKNFTAYEVMQVAEVEDQKYKFEWKMIANKMYVYRIGKVTNDPEDGKFWLLYLVSKNSTNKLEHLYSSPDNLVLKEGDHLVMWYRKAAL